MRQWLSWMGVGWLVGIAQLIPGVSGSTVAVILNRYQPLIQAVHTVLAAPFRFQFSHGVVGVTVVGTGSSLVINAGVMAWLLDQYSTVVYSLFLVLILGSVPVLYRKCKAFQLLHLMGSVGSGLFLGLLVAMVFQPSEVGVVQLSVMDWIVSGFVAMGTMLVPGISGSMMLVLMGTYDAIIVAVAQLDVKALMSLGIGAVLGGVVMVKLVDEVLRRFPLASYCIIVSLLVGSVPILMGYIV